MPITTKHTELLKDKLLVFHINMDWSVYDFRWIFDFVIDNEIYYLWKHRIDKIRAGERAFYVDDKNNLIQSGQIPVKSVKYGSEGWIELICSASIVSAIVALIINYVPNWKQVDEIRQMRTERMEKEIQILKEAGFTEEEIQQFLRPKLKKIYDGVEKFNSMVMDGKITEVKEKDLDDEEEEFL
ncbi:hypothetical protein [Sinomicrobium oceani]|uniref:hypothetical protein n=1 Tax=Sinomicrobium oceani TaxID=1150368 RepID=UPI00227CB1C4|nr:hypothetical protein [Sinomicrobium oceani]